MSVADLSPVVVSPVSETDTEFVTLGTAVVATPTVSVIVLALGAPRPIGPALVQVTACPLAVHAQPVPTKEVNDSPVGNVSTTVMPVAGPVPLFVTVRV